MSYGQKPSAWSRPQGAQQQQINPNLFTNQLGLAATGQAFSGIPAMPLNSGFAGLVNQAAFTNTMNMQSMLAQAQRTHQIIPTQQQVQQPTRHPQQHQQQQQATSPTRSQRAFIGVVTKLMETYGFVDEDVFFQTNVIRGSMPRAGDRVMVEANYNPSMPFKWNASRVQLIQETTQQPPARQPSQQQQNGSVGSRWSERTAAAAADEPSRYATAPASRRSPFTKRSSRQHSPPRRSSPRRRESPKRERDLPTKREREAERERDRAASSARGHSAKRDTDSPPRRRQRVIPRYFCNIPKLLPPKGEFKCADLRRRYTNLYIPSDFIRVDFDWVHSIQLEQPLNFSPHPIQFNVLHKDVDILLAEGEQMPTENPVDADYRYVVKVLVISHPGLSVIRQKISGLQVDGSIDESVEKQSLAKSINLLVGHKGKGEYMCIGGPWSPGLDGPNPMAPQTLIKTAVRTTKSLTGLDLTNCSKWYKMVHLRYFRVERQRFDSVVLMLPDTSTISEFKVTEESYRAAEQTLRDQLAAKLSALEAEEFVPPGQNASALDELNRNTNIESTVLNTNGGENTTEGTSTTDGDKSSQQDTEVNEMLSENVDTRNTQQNTLPPTSVPEAMDTSSVQQNESEGQQQSESTTAQSNTSLFSASSQSAKKETKTPWAKLEPIVRAMKVAELREELELRGLESKGVKNILMQRLMDAIEKEKALNKKKEGNEAAQPQNEANNGGQEAKEQSKEGEKREVEQVQQKEGNEQTAEVPQNEEQQNVVVKEKESIMVKIKEEIIELMETDETTEEKKETPEEKEAREKAEKEKRELEKAKEKFEKDKKERMASLERHYAQIPKELGIFVYPSKTAKSGKFDLKTMSLHSLLDYRLEDSKEASFEVFMFAEAIKEAFDRSNAFVVYHTISTAMDKDEEKKRLNEALAEACKDEDIVCVDEGGGGKKDAKEKEKDDKAGSSEKPKSPTNTIDFRTNFKALVNSFDMFTAFVNFDTNVCGYLNDRDVEEIIYSIGLDLSRAEVQRLIKRLSSKERVNYRNLTDKWVDKEGECKFTPKPTYENLARSYAEHAKGHLHGKLDDNSEKELQQETIDESGIIFYKGALVNVKHCLDQQMLMEQERQNVLDANNQLEMQLKASKDQCGQLEKKKRRLEDDVDRYKKKLHDTEKTLRKEQEDYSAAKKALQDCKRYGERIAGIVVNILPPPKPKETSEKEKDKNASKEKEAIDGIVLIDEAVANPEKEDGNEEAAAENNQEQQQSSKSQDEMDANNAAGGKGDAVDGKQNEKGGEGEPQIGTENDQEKQQE